MSQHQSCFAARSRANLFCHSRLQTRIAGASRWIDQRLHSADATIPRYSEHGPYLKGFFLWNRALATVCTFYRPHLPKVLRDHLVFNILKCRSSSSYSLVRSLPTSSSKSAQRLSVFSILMCKSSSRYSPACFLSTTFPNRAPHPRKQRPYCGAFSLVHSRATDWPDDDMILTWRTWWWQDCPDIRL